MEFMPEQKALNDLFGNDMTYIIPEYQRPYSWDCIGKSDKNNQVNVIWQDTRPEKKLKLRKQSDLTMTTF